MCNDASVCVFYITIAGALFSFLGNGCPNISLSVLVAAVAMLRFARHASLIAKPADTKINWFRLGEKGYMFVLSRETGALLRDARRA